MSFGLPALPSSVSTFVGIALLAADAIADFFGLFPQEWGIFLDGEPVVIADNVVTMEYRQDWRISTYPQENGAFASYNKVAMPFEAKLKFTAGGTLANRQEMLDSIAAIADDTNLYDVITPERIYPSCNITHFDFKREAKDVGLLSVEVWLEEVRVTSAASFSDTKSPGGAGTTQLGIVQARPYDGNVIGDIH